MNSKFIENWAMRLFFKAQEKCLRSRLRKTKKVTTTKLFTKNNNNNLKFASALRMLHRIPEHKRDGGRVILILGENQF
jgi:hypothetical protein